MEQTEINGTTGWLHRKGATPTDKGLIMIPGSRGDYSYLVRPAEDCQISLNTSRANAASTPIKNWR
ncbi:RtcB family protein [Neisseria sp. 27098_8_158]|uniref:hypothetical protein n=1 Tax=Neisseria sp. 27098_8_158 TaxID=3003680 RepID=UPI00352D5EAA